MPGEAKKIFRDSIHGYIALPTEWCQQFVDTPIFQRLRRIEQTSIRCLYPCATHNRFVHSLGTYHLACMVVKHLFDNSSVLLASISISNEDQQRCENSFLVASLMHDCAHAPFSHICEHYYDIGGALTPHLLDVMKDDADFTHDWTNCEPSPHEKASAIILRRHFDQAIRDVGGDPALAARMIIGCLYDGVDITYLQKLYNIFISLLNGPAIDVDKLDYIIRDTWASGVNNVSIDVDRLLAAIEVKEHEGRIRTVFRRTALSVIQQVVDARNFIYRWIVGHHRVTYDNHLLETAVKGVAAELAKIETANNKPPKGRRKNVISVTSEDVLARLFSLDSFERPIDVGGYRFYLLCDADLIYLFGLFQNEVPEVKEWLHRGQSRFPVWKSYAEFKHHFANVSPADCNRMQRHISEGLLNNIPGGEMCVSVSTRTKDAKIHDGEIMVNIVGDEIKSFTDLVRRSQDDDHDLPFFYLYQHNYCMAPKDEIISRLKSSL